MAKATLTYDLADPDDESAHRYALAGKDAIIALWRVENRIRDILKRVEPGEEAARLLEEVRMLIPHDLTELLA